MPQVSSAQVSVSPGRVMFDAGREMGPPWHAIWTRSHCERLVRDQLAAKGFHPFMPTIAIWASGAGSQHRVELPMFPGYVFVHDAVDKRGYLEVRKSRGVVALLGKSWDRLAVIPAREMEWIQRLQAAGLDVTPHPFLRVGQRVRVVEGALTGVEGILMQINARKGRLIISIEMLQRSLAVELDCSTVTRA